MAAQVNYILAAGAVPAFFLAGRADLELHVPYPVIRHRHSVKSLAVGEVSASQVFIIIIIALLLWRNSSGGVHWQPGTQLLITSRRL